MSPDTQDNNSPALHEQSCEACSIGTIPLLEEEIADLAEDLSSDWVFDANLSMHRLFKFKNFREALHFVNLVGELAETEGHHPDIELGWGRVKISLMTHKIHGLSLYDLILASKIDRLL